jgi:hypothetical protein
MKELILCDVPDGYHLIDGCIIAVPTDSDETEKSCEFTEITLPSEDKIDDKIQDIGKGLGIEGMAGARLMIEWYCENLNKINP